MGAEEKHKETQSSWHGQARQENRPPKSKMKLTDFMRSDMEHIVIEWENFARTLIPAAANMTSLALRDHIHQILDFIIKDIKSPQTGQEQIEKSQGGKEKESAPSAAEMHAALRLSGGFDIEQMVSEYRALRASVIKLWSRANTEFDSVDLQDMTRFSESIDQALAESVSHYTYKVNYSKDLLLGILSHDLRTPLGVVSMSAQLLTKLGGLNERQDMLVMQIFESTSRVTQIVNDLLDITRARFGDGLPIKRVPMDMGVVSRTMIDEMRAAYPTRTILLDVSGEMKGEWDKARIGQVFANLIGNAVQYSFLDSPIRVTVNGAPEEVIFSVHNEGVPMPVEGLEKIFDSMTRAVTHEGEHPSSVNLGLGLYIAKDIVVSHGGTIDVNSSEEEGTTFTVRLPR